MTITKIGELQLATFYVDDVLLGINIREIQEINRQRDITTVPHTPASVRGVINLRGEVVTVLDMRTIFGLGVTDFQRSTRNMILRSEGEPVGLLVDRLADVVTVLEQDIDAPPANVSGIDAQFMRGVVKLPTEIVVVVKVEEVCACTESSSSN